MFYRWISLAVLIITFAARVPRDSTPRDLVREPGRSAGPLGRPTFAPTPTPTATNLPTALPENTAAPDVAQSDQVFPYGPTPTAACDGFWTWWVDEQIWLCLPDATAVPYEGPIGMPPTLTPPPAYP